MAVPERTSSEPAAAPPAPDAAGSNSLAPDDAGSDIELTLPADPVHVPVARALAADLAVRLDYDLDEVSDLRMAVDEACAELVAKAAGPGRLRCVFQVDEDALRVTVSASTKDGATPGQNTFGWRVLTALVDEVTAWASGDNIVHIKLVKYRLEAHA
ncbi:ATP-binding protein [Cryptosporangium minutisporangium]|uniref:Anti-sigma regulatory factor n=1 Tax=Cryptosporangium minutisporangium TaxID=113569 RepID=A0ABP6SQB1_9ACTN